MVFTFQQMLQKLEAFWAEQGCAIHHGYDLEVGAGTFNPATFLRSLGPEPYKAFYIEPCRRPTDGRYGTNPNRLQHYFQCQVILKPSPPNIQDLCLQSLEAIGFNLKEHDMRFVHDDWEAPTLGAWGLGWEVWMDGMEVTQFTYFQNVAGMSLKPITGEVTYGLERLAVHLQKVDSLFDIRYNDTLTYGDIYHRSEVEWSHYNFDLANTAMWLRHFEDYEREAQQLIANNYPLPAYDFVMKASHAFNLLDARGVISVTERTGYITRLRDLACAIAACYLASRQEQGYPLLKTTLTPLLPMKEASSNFTEATLAANTLTHEDFLLEIGSEELPASFVPLGCRLLEKSLRHLLEKEGIAFHSLKVVGTPRRLVAFITQMALTVAPQKIEKRGPTLDQIYTAEGSLKPAGEGFFRSLHLSAPTLTDLKEGLSPIFSMRQVKESTYLYANLESSSKSTVAILSQALGPLILALEFPKKMRWADLDISYARPLRWLVALLGTQVIPFEVGPLRADRHSYGHRQLNPNSFEIPQARDYFTLIKEHHVMVDQEERKQSILAQLTELEQQSQCKILACEQVIPQVVNLVEWPFLTTATFAAEFLQAPREVLISEMVEHQKYFPVSDLAGNLKNLFVITANMVPTEAVRRGNQKALSPRLSDGVFLYEQGLKKPLETYNEKLKQMTFQKELGSVYHKVERLIKNSTLLQQLLGISSASLVQRAALLSKADLASEMVFEFPELQGVIGRYYALAQGEEREVALAIEEQWMPLGENRELPTTATGLILSLADKIDNLLGCFVAGLKPTSSSDPYALRRQALGLIKIVLQEKYSFSLRKILQEALLATYPQVKHEQQVLLIDEISAFIALRAKTVFQELGLAKDEIEACYASGFDDLYAVNCRLQALHHFRLSDQNFSLLHEVYKRAKGQIEHSPLYPFSVALLQELAEKELYELLSHIQLSFKKELALKNYLAAYELLAKLQPALASLFKTVKIKADDLNLCHNRISLLQQVFQLFEHLLDFSKIQVLKN